MGEKRGITEWAAEGGTQHLRTRHHIHKQGLAEQHGMECKDHCHQKEGRNGREGARKGEREPMANTQMKETDRHT